jgi:sulfatase modifying factor 1
MIPLLLSIALTCPSGMVPVAKTGTCIDKYEWPNKKGKLPTIALSGIQSEFDKRDGIVMDAESMCASVGKRVCEHEEWIAACRGPRGSDYPFGYKLPKITKQEEAPCNYAKPYTEPDGMKVFLRDPKELARLDKRDPSGSRGCVSASGAEDMMGNVEEWIRCPGISRHKWCLAGRYWSEPLPCYRILTGHTPNWHWYTTGTRCCLSLPRNAIHVRIGLWLSQIIEASLFTNMKFTVTLPITAVGFGL